jgi:hypothetical protein
MARIFTRPAPIAYIEAAGCDREIIHTCQTTFG